MTGWVGLLGVDYRVVFNGIKHKKRKDREIRRRTEVRKKNNRILLENGIFGMYVLADSDVEV